LKFINILFSFKVTALLLVLLALGAGYATIIENDYGTSTARVLVYNNLWYETVLILTTINMLGIIFKYKMWKHKARFVFHTAFVVILIGAGVTRYVGYEGIIQIKENTTENRMTSLEPYLQVTIHDNSITYYKEYQKEFTTLLKPINNFTHTIKFDNKSLNLDYKNFLLVKKGRAKMGMLTLDVTLDGVTKEVKLPGKRSQKGFKRELKFGDTVVFLEYGSKIITLPFSIRLNDFKLDRYAGSMSPSSYASEVTVFKEDGSSYDYRIFMNKTLHQGNFLFFQSSYFPDETGTVLSVNNDPGKWPTYLGYFLLTLGLILNFFDKKSRFWVLTKSANSKNLVSLLFGFFIIFTSASLYAEDHTNHENKNLENLRNNANHTGHYLKGFKKNSKQTASYFARLVTQGSMGRMKPVSTLNQDILLKISGQSSLMNMNSDQVILGMLSRPELWKNVKMIKIKTPKLKKFLGVSIARKYISFLEVFKDGKYILGSEIEKASQTNPQNRGTYEKDLIKLDERLNIMFTVYNGNIFNLFPKDTSISADTDNNKWFTPLDAMKDFQGENQEAVKQMVRGFINSVIENKWTDANKFISMISIYQQRFGSSIMLSSSEIDNEIFFNKLNLFSKLTVAYVILGIMMLIVAFFVVFNPKIKPKKTTYVFFILLAVLFAIHTFGMGFRWFISGHAPWSNTYESLLYISWSAVFAGVAFFKRSLLALSAAVIVAGIFMFTAHLTGIDPQITNLAPVLKSYWLTIHVSILTASYGFFGLGAILGLMILVMFIFRKNRPHIDATIKNIVAITEIALIIGLVALTIGNFLGGVWANESWGRYWGWDPKETWAYVTIVVYVLVLHLRFVKPLNTPFVFATAALVSFSTILMTYFGVNFYLSGMHSYATGDPVPIPQWVYYVTAIVLITIALAYKNRDLKKK
jgi:cytochrome c-type biogenesis protein CcsB